MSHALVFITNAALQQAATVVESVAHRADVKRFRIGRTNAPIRRLVEHRRRGTADGLELVHNAPDAEAAARMEEALLRHFAAHPKLDNAVLDSRGDVDEDAAVHYVYVAWTI